MSSSNSCSVIHLKVEFVITNGFVYVLESSIVIVSSKIVMIHALVALGHMKIPAVRMPSDFHFLTTALCLEFEQCHMPPETWPVSAAVSGVTQSLGDCVLSCT